LHNHLRLPGPVLDRLAGLAPLISFVDNTRERLRAITKDKRLYTMDESEVKVQKTLLKPPSATGTCSSPGRSKDLVPPKL
jgi:hypothetical protein